jgi:uncharacterized protein (DUF736 family)
MTGRDRPKSPVYRLVARWLDLGRGWQAAALGVGTVLACRLVA